MQNNSSQNAIYLIVDRLKSSLNVSTDTDLAKILGVRQNTISSWKTRGSIDYAVVIAKCDEMSIDLNWLFGTSVVDVDKNCKEDKKNSDANGDIYTKNGYPSSCLSLDGEFLTEKKCIPKCIPECIPAENLDKKNAKANVQAFIKPPLVISTYRDVPTFEAREVDRGGIPLIPIAAAAGILSGTGVQIMDYECEYFDIPGFKNADFMIQVTGDSMVPKYESGDVVACQRLLTSTFIQWNNVYVVDSEQGILIKRLNPGSDKEHIKLVSENEKYGPFELHRSAINGLGRVVGLVRFE